ncbi:MAG TPA: molybdopterin-dependent oxidoreductase [Streptosporangiaceae bacterium]|nr:molybdopterin-dependent oxidoreductase [Streptosporangiaceae bacterium]
MKEFTQRSRAALSATAVGGLIGLLAAAAALGVAELMAGVTGTAGEPVIAVGGAAIDLTPIPVKDFAIQHFGSHDKTVLLTGIYVVLALFAMLTGILARRRIGYGLAGLGVFAALGVAAVLTRPVTSPVDAVPTAAGVIAGALVLVLLVRAGPAPAGLRGESIVPVTEPVVVPSRPAPQPGGAPGGGPGRGAGGRGGPGRGGPGGPDRRRFLITAAGAAALAVGGAGAGQALLARFNVSAARSGLTLPAPAVTGPRPPGGAQLDVPGISPFTTPSGSFYRVDTALSLPQVPPKTWHLRVHGMVERELDITFDQLLKRPLTEADITLACVSNQVGGPYVGNARWLGASLAGLLREARVKRGADQILSTSADGWTCGTPIQTVMDGRNALLAVAMNGQPLPVAHGFPARMMVPGLYGYVSATKWVVDLEITTFAAARSYWVQRGYSTRAPIKAESRIDVPRPLAQVKGGRTAVAGVAWAPHRGIDAVQVRADNGPWNQARLAPVPGIDTWRQWVWEWDAPRGLHTLQVRATDGTHATQPSRRVPIFPNGATGWDTVTVTVT